MAELLQAGFLVGQARTTQAARISRVNEVLIHASPSACDRTGDSPFVSMPIARLPRRFATTGSGSAPAKWIDDQIARLGGHQNNPLQQFLGQLVGFTGFMGLNV
jgi:hypothetical protein